MKERVAADVMNPEVMAVRPEMGVSELALFLTENQISGAPVMDAHGRLLGVVSLSDIAQGEAEDGRLAEDRSDPGASVRGWEEAGTTEEMRALHVEGGGDRTVRDIMTPTTYAVAHDTPVALLARAMIAGRIHRLLVVREQRVVGIVTSLDLLKLLAEEERPAPASRGGKAGAARRGRAGGRARRPGAAASRSGAAR